MIETPIKQQQFLSDTEADNLRRSFADNGFVVIRNAIPRTPLADLAASILSEFERQKQSGELFRGGGLVSGHLNAFTGAQSRFVYETLQERGIIDLVQSMTSQPLAEPNVGCNFNLPGSVAQHYHMDRTFTHEFMIVNIAVVDTDIANGAIQLIPGSHKKFYPYWKFQLDRLPSHSIRLPMSQGDILIRVSNLWHRGMPNFTNVGRPMMALTWEDGGSRVADSFAREGGRITFYPNWFRPSTLGRIRERVMVNAPWTYGAYRIADSVFNSAKAYGPRD
jgi:ectoine hydroxylase-related dioxygenase (phytanoyl-CoA dioxygenase family)